MTLGIVIIKLIAYLTKKIVDYAAFVFPTVPLILVVIAIFIICLVTPSIVFHISSKSSVTEYKLLEVLAKSKGTVLTKEILLFKLWDDNGTFVDENTLSVNVRRLRKKIEEDSKNPEYIITVFGIGYCLGE